MFASLSLNSVSIARVTALGFAMADSNKTAATEVLPEGTTMQPAGAMKPHYQCSTKECRAELETVHGQRPNDDLSLPELRTILKECRRQKGMIKPKTRDTLDPVTRAKTAGVKELQKMCADLGVKVQSKATVGDMRLAIRVNGAWITLPELTESYRVPPTGGEPPVESSARRVDPDAEAAGRDPSGARRRQAPQELSSQELPEEPPGEFRIVKGSELGLLTVNPESIPEGLLGSMVLSDRLFLLEVACGEDSVLCAEAERRGWPIQRAGLHNGFDLCEAAGLRRLIDVIRACRPKHVWVSTECGAFSPLQNLNQRTQQQKECLRNKQREARKQHLAAIVVRYVARASGCHVHWEWSRRCRAWSWDPMDRMRQDLGMSTAIIGGCRVGLLAKDSHSVMGKEWRIESTCPGFARDVHLPCLGKECTGTHVSCQGQLSRMSAFYTPKMAKRVVHYMEQDRADINSCVPKIQECQCSKFKWKGLQTCCPWCMLENENMGPQALVQQGPDPGTPCPRQQTKEQDPKPKEEDPFADTRPTTSRQTNKPGSETKTRPLTKEEEKKWLHRIHLLHGATGHGSHQQLKDTLEKKKVDPRIVSLVDSYRCSICEERKRPAPRRVATLEVHPDRWKVVLTDGAHWVHPKTGVRNVIGLYMDQCSRFLVGKVLVQGKTELPNADCYVKFFQEHWQQYFGKPETLRFDAEGTWRSKALDEAFTQMGIYMDPVPGDAHWHISPLERCIEWLKECMSKLVGHEPQVSPHSALACAIEAWNNREVVRGYSPRQHALGQVPDAAGRLFESDLNGFPVHMMSNPEGEVAHAARLRGEAEATFARWQAQQRVSRALNSKQRPIPEYVPGDLDWRSQLYGKKAGGTRIQTGRSAGYAGPARVLALETRRDEDQKIRPSSVVWLVRNNRLLKASVEQLRFASQREELLHEFERPSSLPWTMTELTSPLTKEGYEDITAEVPSQADKDEYGEQPNWRPTRRVRQKQSGQLAPSGQESNSEPADTKDEPMQSQSVPRERSRSPRPAPETQQSFWAQPAAAVELEIPMPTTKHGWKMACRDLETYLASALKKKSAEVYEKHMDEDTKAKFLGAKNVEIKKFLVARALEALPPDKQPSKTEAMRMRWILSWKTDHSGATVPKARAVVLGFQDPNYENRVTYAPTTTRHTRQLILQMPACHGWHAWKGDVSAAFLQGRECSQNLYCIPTPELCSAMGIPKESVTRLRKACYGLVQAPYEWYETVRSFLLEIGFFQCATDPCCWVLQTGDKVHAIISGHVDDFMMVGDPKDTTWIHAMESIRNKFRWGEFELNDFTQCGVQIQRQSDGSFTLSQGRYMQHVREIPISAQRRSQRKEATTEQEKTQLRALLGALSWHANQVGFRYAAYVSLSLSEVPQSTVEALLAANQLLHKMRDAAHEPMLIHALGSPEEVSLVAWTDASNQNRHDGSSTGGIFIGATHKSILDGAMCAVSPVFWSSSKLQRVCRSPGSAEARAAIDGEDALWLLRYQWSELLGKRPVLRNPDHVLSQVPGVLVTDSRNVYDRMQQPYISPTGEQKRVDLELLVLKESQNRTQLEIRWVNAQAMLANSLTKRGEDQQFDRFVACKYRWKIVDDPNMFSGRERSKRGLDGLDEPELQTVAFKELEGQEAMQDSILRKSWSPSRAL